MSRHPDPIIRRILAYDRAQARVKRRVAALLTYIDAHPDACGERRNVLRRLDGLLGQADRLRRALS